jgi:hypothetical protein
MMAAPERSANERSSRVKALPGFSVFLSPDPRPPPGAGSGSDAASMRACFAQLRQCGPVRPLSDASVVGRHNRYNRPRRAC